MVTVATDTRTREATVTGPKATAIYRKHNDGTYVVQVWKEGRFYNTFAFAADAARRAWEFAGVVTGALTPGEVADGDDVDED